MLKKVIFVTWVFIFFSCLIANGENKFGFPESTCKILILTDQLPGNMSERQIRFVANHYVGSQKLTLSISKRIRFYTRLLKRPFVVLHYHLGIWQQNPKHQFIIDGEHWGNDWDYVTQHEEWFWHNEKGERVYSRNDGKYLMNISNKSFREYWKHSILKQIKAGNYQGVFLDSANIGLLQWEASHLDPRLARTSARNRKFKELGGKSWKETYKEFMKDLTVFLEKNGYATIPNTCGLFTTWDDTDYYTTASGAFIEGAFDTKNSNDWKMAMDRTLRLIKRDKIVIFQSYLKSNEDIRKRMYYLSCYLLIKGNYCYLMYFHRGCLSWYPEFDIKLGCPKKKIILSLRDIQIRDGIYKREYENGEVWVNVSRRPYKIKFGKIVRQVVPIGGGPVDRDGNFHGKLEYEDVENLSIMPWTGIVVLYK
ncbi:hypothetical protein JCM12298_16370 [Desulfothermus naphthae]